MNSCFSRENGAGSLIEEIDRAKKSTEIASNGGSAGRNVHNDADQACGKPHHPQVVSGLAGVVTSFTALVSMSIAKQQKCSGSHLRLIYKSLRYS